MSDLRETIEVLCPPFYVMHHAERFFTVHRRDHTPGTLTLRVDLSSLKLPGTSEARHDVHVTHERVDEDGRRTLRLSWDPQDQTVPQFSGTLSSSEKDPGTATLLLEGTYKPPMGMAGAAFDLVVGRKIAAATARALLGDIKAFIESDYQTARETNLAFSPKE